MVWTLSKSPCQVETVNHYPQHWKVLWLMVLLPEPGFSLSLGKIYASLFSPLKSSSNFLRLSSPHRMRRKRTTPILGWALFFPLNCEWSMLLSLLAITLIDGILDLLVHLGLYLHDTNWWVCSISWQKEWTGWWKVLIPLLINWIQPVRVPSEQWVNNPGHLCNSVMERKLLKILPFSPHSAIT